MGSWSRNAPSAPPGSGLVTLLAAVPMAVFLALPVIALLVNRTGSIASELADSSVRSAVTLSLRTTLMSLVLTVLFGTPLALTCSRSPNRLAATLGFFVELPIVLPPAAAGIGLLLAFGRHGLIPTSLPFSTGAVVLAQVFVSAPIYIRGLSAALQRVEPQFEEAAALDGAGKSRVLSKITFPLVSGTIVVGMMLAWARALGEFGATLLFAGNLSGVTQTMPLAIYLGFQSGIDQAVGLSVILLGVAAIVLLCAHMLRARLSD